MIRCNYEYINIAVVGEPSIHIQLLKYSSENKGRNRGRYED